MTPIIKTPKGQIFLNKNGKAELKWNVSKFTGKSYGAWQALTTKTGKWTLQDGDFMVKGLVTDEIGAGFTMTALKAKYDDVVMIKSVDTMDAGSSYMQHWQIGAS